MGAPRLPARALGRSQPPAGALSLRARGAKVVGVGSVGTRAWIILLLGRDNDDPLFLQLEQAEASVLEPFLGKWAIHLSQVVLGRAGGRTRLSGLLRGAALLVPGR